MKNLPIAVGLAFASFGKLAGLPVALAFIVQMLTASLFYCYLSRQPAAHPGSAARAGAAAAAGRPRRPVP